MDNNALFLLIFIASVFISSVSQVMLKTAANKEYKSVAAQYLNPRVIGAYGLFFISTLITVYAFKYVPLSLGPILESLGYIFVGILGVLVLKETVGKQAFFGMVLIVVGVIIFSL